MDMGIIVAKSGVEKLVFQVKRGPFYPGNAEVGEG